MHAAFFPRFDHLLDDIQTVQFAHDAFVRVGIRFLTAIVTNHATPPSTGRQFEVNSVQGKEGRQGDNDDGNGNLGKG